MTDEPDPLQAQYDGIPVPCYTWRADGDGFVLERANRAAHERFGGHLAALIGRRLDAVYPDRPDIAVDVATSLAERRTVRREMDHTLASSGEIRRLDVSYVFVPPDRVMIHAEDITARRESEERLRAVIGTIESGLLTLDSDGVVTDANPAACRILGLDREQLVSDRDWWRALAPRRADGAPVDPEAGLTPGRLALRGESARDVEMRITRPSGDVAMVSVNYQPLHSGPRGEPNGLVVSRTTPPSRAGCRSASPTRRCTTRLTGLPNRLLFQERLKQALARPVPPPVAVLLLGLDRFRAVNDTLGPAAADDVLVEVASRLHQVLDLAEPLARVGGDEFAVLTECEDERGAAALAQRLSTAPEAPFGAGVRIGAAVGIAIEHPGRDGEDLMQGADAAMQRVKARGGGGFEVYDRPMEGRLRDRLRIEEGLRRAIERDELRLVYQPIVQLDPLRVVALEALVRWQHPEEGLLGPGRFLPVAEQDARG